MRRISCCTRLLACAFLSLSQVSCASSYWGSTRAEFSSAVTGSVQSDAHVFEEAIWRCRQAILSAAKPYGVVDVAFWSVGSLPSAYGGPAVSTVVTAVYRRQGGLERRTAAIECRFGEKGVVVVDV